MPQHTWFPTTPTYMYMYVKMDDFLASQFEAQDDNMVDLAWMGGHIDNGDS